MNPKIEKLQTEKAENDRKIEQLEHRQQRIENRINYIKQGERKARAHRLITRGAAVESIVPAVKSMTEPEFYELMETILTDPAVASLLPKDDT